MRLSRLIVIGAAFVVATLSGILAVVVGQLAGLSFLSGALLGAASLGGLTAAGVAVSGGRSRGRRGLAVAAHLLKYPIIIGVLYLMLTRVRADAALVVAGYTGALAAFVVSLALGKPPKGGSSQAE